MSGLHFLIPSCVRLNSDDRPLIFLSETWTYDNSRDPGPWPGHVLRIPRKDSFSLLSRPCPLSLSNQQHARLVVFVPYYVVPDVVQPNSIWVRVKVTGARLSPFARYLRLIYPGNHRPRRERKDRGGANWKTQVLTLELLVWGLISCCPLCPGRIGS